MTLEDFEKLLAEDKLEVQESGLDDLSERSKKRRKHHHHHHHHRVHANDNGQSHHKRSRHSRKDENEQEPREVQKNTQANQRDDIVKKEEWVEKEANLPNSNGNTGNSGVASQTMLKRDSWMENPTSLEIDFIQRPSLKRTKPTTMGSSRADFELKVHKNELNKHHLQDLTNSEENVDDHGEESVEHCVEYTIGDEGAHWRMTKLEAVYNLAEETQRPINEIAMDRFGSLRAFEQAKREEIELERRETYGEDYITKEKPSGDLFRERKPDIDKQSSGAIATYDGHLSEQKASTPEDISLSQEAQIPIDQTALNKLKARMMKAQLKGSSDASILEEEYAKATTRFESRRETEVIVLGPMESRMLTERKGGVKESSSKRERERGLLEENEHMSVEDMVREERRTRHQAGGDGRRFAERIARDGKFDVTHNHSQFVPALILIQNNLDYLDENANRLAKRVQKSEINLKNVAVSDFQKMNRILDNCPLCFREDESTPPVAPVVSLATRVYLTLPTQPEISDGGASIIPVQHRGNLLECDDDEWEEIRVGLLSC